MIVRGGEFKAGADPPDWDWTPLDNGLPEAAVQDLTIEKYGDRRLLRAALQSRGVWELELEGPPAPTTYLQSAMFDGRRGIAAPSLAGFPNTATDFLAPPATWFDSPDVSVRTAPGSVPPAPAVTITESNERQHGRELWQFQVALHNVDPTCRPVGGWTASFDRRLVAYRRTHPVGPDPVPEADRDKVDADVWGQVVTVANAFEPMWDGIEPTEADLLELVRRDRTGDRATLVLPGIADVDVLVHHRDSRSLAAGDVRVTLLRRTLSANALDWDAVPLEADACAALVSTLTTGTVAAMPAPWEYADLGSAVRHPNLDVSARSPRVATFRIATGSAGDVTLLVAAVNVGGSEVIATSAGLVKDLVVTDHHLAARIIQAG